MDNNNEEFFLFKKDDLDEWFVNNPAKYESYKEMWRIALEDYLGTFDDANDLPKDITYFLFLYNENDLIGMLSFSLINNYQPYQRFGINKFIYVEDIVVNKNYRKRGYCSKILKELFRIKKENDYILTVDEINEPAIKCYEKNGFQELDMANGVLTMIKPSDNQKGGYFNKYKKYKTKYLKLKNIIYYT